MARVTSVASLALSLSDEAGEISLVIHTKIKEVSDDADRLVTVKQRIDSLRRSLFLISAAVLNPAVTLTDGEAIYDVDEFLRLIQETLQSCQIHFKDWVYVAPGINGNRKATDTDRHKLRELSFSVDLHDNRLRLILLLTTLIARCSQPKKLVGTVIVKIEEVTSAVLTMTAAEQVCQNWDTQVTPLASELGHFSQRIILMALKVVQKAPLADRQLEDRLREEPNTPSPEMLRGGVSERRLEKYYTSFITYSGRHELSGLSSFSVQPQVVEQLAKVLPAHTANGHIPDDDVAYHITETYLQIHVSLVSLDETTDAELYLNCAMRSSEKLNDRQRDQLKLTDVHFHLAGQYTKQAEAQCNEDPPALEQAEQALRSALKEMINLSTAQREEVDLPRVGLRLVIRHLTQFWGHCDEGDVVKAELRLQKILELVQVFRVQNRKCTTLLLRAHLGLARAYLKEEQHNRAQEILFQLTLEEPDDNSTALILADASHLLARMLALSHNFADAKINCERAIGLRGRNLDSEHEDYYQGVELMACICDADGDDTTSALYASLLPASWDWSSVEDFRQKLRTQKSSILTLNGHVTGVAGVAFRACGSILATASLDGKVLLWDISTGGLVLMFGDENEEVTIPALMFSHSGRLLVRTRNHQIDIWDIESGELHQQLDDTPALDKSTILSSISFTPTDRLVTGRLWNSNITFWDVQLGCSTQIFDAGSMDVRGMICSPCGQYLAYTSIDAIVNILDAISGQAVTQLKPVTGQSPYSLAFSPDSSLLAAIWNFAIIVFNVSTGQQEFLLEGHTSPVESIAFSPNGMHLASGAEDGKVKVWDLTTRRAIHTLEEHTDGVSALAFSPVGNWLVSCSYDKSVRLWNV